MKFKRILSILAALCLIISLLPTAAFAGDDWTEVSTETDLSSAISSGGNIRLTANIKANITVITRKTVTLDLNGYTLSNSNTNATVTCKGTLTIQDSSINKSGQITSTNNYSLFVSSSGKVIIEGGTYNSSTTFSIYVNSGTLTMKNVTVLGKGIGAVEIEDGDITITSGKFATKPLATYIAEGSTLSDTTDTEGYYTVTGPTANTETSTDNEPSETSDYVAEVNGKQYTLSELQDAVDAAISEGYTLTLLADIPDSCELNFSGELTVSLGGHKWSAENSGTGIVKVDGAASNFTVTAAVDAAADRISGNDTVDVIADDEITVTVSVSGGDYYGAYVELTAGSDLGLKGNLPDGWETVKNGTYKYFITSTSAVSSGAIGTFKFKIISGADDTDAAITVTAAQISASYDEAVSTVVKPAAATANASVHIINNRAVTIPTANDSAYDGDTHTSGIAATDYYTVEDTGGKNVGEYTALVTLKYPEVYYWDNAGKTTSPLSIAYNITATNIVVQAAPTLAANPTYTGNPLELVADDAVISSPASGAKVVYCISDGAPAADVAGTAKDSTTATTVGTYTVWYKVTADNYIATAWTQVGTVTIAAAEISDDWFSAPSTLERVADGTTSALVTAAEATNASGAPALSFQYRLSESDAWSDDMPTATDADTYTVYYKVSAANYTDKTGSVSVTLRAATYYVAETQYIASRKMIYVFTSDNVRFQYDGASMYDVTAMGYGYVSASEVSAEGTSYNHVYALLLDSGIDYNQTNLTAVSADSALAGTVAVSALGANDVNNDKHVTIDDAVVVSGVANACDSYFKNNMKAVFRADVNRNGNVEVATDGISIKDVCAPVTSSGAAESAQ